MNFLILAAMLAVSAAAPQQHFAYRRVDTDPLFTKPAITITKTANKPFSYQVPAPITSNEATVIETAQPQFTQPLPHSRPHHQPIQIIKLERSQQPSGDYSFFYQSENGIQAQEKAVIKPIRDEKNEEHLVPSVEGSYSYTGPDGVQYTITYVADEFGYRATGAHIPVPVKDN